MQFFIKKSDTAYNCEAEFVYCGNDIEDAIQFSNFMTKNMVHLTVDDLEQVYLADMVEDYIRYKMNEYEKIELYNMYATDQEEEPIETYDNAYDYAKAKGSTPEEQFDILNELYEDDMAYEGEYIKRGHYCGDVIGSFDDVFDESYYTDVAEWASDEGLYAVPEIRNIARMFEDAEEEYHENWLDYQDWQIHQEDD